MKGSIRRSTGANAALIYFKKQSGLTLIEIMISISILAVLAVFAIPSSNQLSKSNTLSVTKAIEEVIRLGRAEAKTRTIETAKGLWVTLCPYNNARTGCSAAGNAAGAATSWKNNGWVLYVESDANADGNIDFIGYDAGDTIIISNTDYAGKQYTITFGGIPTGNRITFAANRHTDSALLSPITIATTDTTRQYRITIDANTGQTSRKQL